jgi:hypothetical protein
LRHAAQHGRIQGGACPYRARFPATPAAGRAAACELALALLHWEGDTPAELDAQVGLGAAVQLKLGGDGMCAYRQWRNERRKRLATHSVT